MLHLKTTTVLPLKDDNVSLAKELEHVRKTLTAERKRTEQSLDDKEILIQELKERKKAANQQIAALTMELSVARTKLDEVDNLNSTISSITKELEDAKKELKEAKQSINNLEKDAETVKASHKEELTSLKKQAEHDKKIQDSNHKMQLELLKNSMNADKQSALLEPLMKDFWKN